MATSLPGDYLAGLVDGEGCFALTFRRDVRRERSNSPVYFRWKAVFAVVMRKDELPLMELVKSKLGCGRISFSKGNVSYQVQDTNDLQTIIAPFFRKHRLYGKKADDFKLWSEAVEILMRNRHKILKTVKARERKHQQWNKKDVIRLHQIRDLMRVYKGKRGPYKWN